MYNVFFCFNEKHLIVYIVCYFYDEKGLKYTHKLCGGSKDIDLQFIN